MQTFEAIQQDFPQHGQLLDQIKTFYNNKYTNIIRYWYQFGEALLALTSFQEVQSSDHVLRVFEACFDNPIINMDRITMAILANRAVDRLPSKSWFISYRGKTSVLQQSGRVHQA